MKFYALIGAASLILCGCRANLSSNDSVSSMLDVTNGETEFEWSEVEELKCVEIRAGFGHRIPSQFEIKRQRANLFFSNNGFKRISKIYDYTPDGYAGWHAVYSENKIVALVNNIKMSAYLPPFRQGTPILDCKVKKLSDQPGPEGNLVIGYNFDGLKTKKALGTTMCPEILTPVGVACQNVSGNLIETDDCENLCSSPVSNSLSAKVSGYDFDGYATRTTPAPNDICTAILRPLDEQCNKIEGAKVIYGSNCNNLCSLPVAEQGHVAGFEFDKWTVAKVLPSYTACPEVLSELELLCRQSKGKIVTGDNCQKLCSHPILEPRR